MCAIRFSVSGAQLQSSTDRPCPGESVTFTCTITSLAHRWEVPFLNIIQPLNPASQRDGVISNLQFQFAVIEVIADTLITSTATVNATENLNGTLVSCTDGNLVVPDDGQNNTINLRGKRTVIVYTCKLGSQCPPHVTCLLTYSQ